MLVRLQQWVLDRQGKNGKAAAVVAAQHVQWLTEGHGALAPADVASMLQSLVGILLWGTKYAHMPLAEQVAVYLSQQAPAGPHRRPRQHARC